MSDLAQDRLTIFKTCGAMTPDELKFLRTIAIEHLVNEGHNFDVNAKDDLIIGCRYCRKKLGELVEEEMHEMERLDFVYARLNLDKELEGTLYAFGNVGRWDGRRKGHKRLTKTLDRPNPGKDPKWRGGWMRSDNLNLVLDWFGNDDIHVFYDTTDGNIRSEGSHHDGTNSYLFREFVRCPYLDGDTRREEGEEELDEEAFEAMLYCAKSHVEWLATINDYTKPLGHYMAKIYGWPIVSGEEALCGV